MAYVEALVFFLLVPAGASGVGVFVLFTAYRQVGSGSRAEIPLRTREARGRVLPLLGVLVAPVLLGLILWWLGLPFAADLDAGLLPEASNLARLHFWSAVAFGWVAAVTIGCGTWVARHRMKQVLSAEFGRVLPLVVIPESLTILALTLVFLIFDLIGNVIETGASLSTLGVDATALGLVGFAVTALATPVGIFFSNRVETLDRRGFIRALLPVEAAAGVAIAGLLYAFLQIGALAG